MGFRGHLKKRHPRAVVRGSKVTSNEEEDVDEPPDTTATERQQFSNSRAQVPQTKPVNTQKAQKYGIEERGEEVVSCVPQARVIRQCERPIPETFKIGQRMADYRSEQHVTCFHSTPFVAAYRSSCCEQALVSMVVYK